MKLSSQSFSDGAPIPGEFAFCIPAAEGHVSLMRPKKAFVTPRALALEEIPGIVEAYRNGSTPMIVGRNDVLLSMDENWNAAREWDEHGRT